MRILIIMIAFFGLTGCQSPQEQTLSGALAQTNKGYFDIHYSEGDNAFSVKNPVIISAILPYNVQWSFVKGADVGCANLKRHRGDSYLLTIDRKPLNNCHVQLAGVVVNSYGEEIDSVVQSFVIQQATPENTKADWLSGSWGIRFAIPGGVELAQSNVDWVAGAKEAVDQLSTFGHVMLNLTANAKGFRYLLKDNAYVDIASEISPDLVPSANKGDVLFNVIDTFKAHNKKVILYIAADGPSAYMLQRHGYQNPELQTAWENYYNAKHHGDEGAAWRTLLKGFLERLKGKVDGYWIDHVDHMPGDLTEFIKLIKAVDPTVIVGLNRSKNYLKDADEQYLQVTSDSHGKVKKPYKVVSLTPLDPFSDFTNGHPTPLAYGAQPNSWAYEEFTFNEVAQAPWVFNYDKPVLRHWFGPLRTQWQGGELLFGTEQAYRFVRTLTDAGGGITWANTVTNGQINPDDMQLLKAIDKKMQLTASHPYVPYKRPAGAALLNEK